MSRGGVPGLVAIFFIALAVRVGAIVAFQGLAAPPDADASPDQLEYEAIAWNLVESGRYEWKDGAPTAMRPPGTPLMLLPVYLLFGRSYLAARLWIALFSSLTCVASAWLGIRYGGLAVGMITGLWLAFYPGHFYYATHFLSEPFYGFWLALAACFAFVAFTRSGWLAPVLAGAAWGAAILTRVELAAAVAVAWAFVVFVRAPARRNVIRVMAIQTLVAALVVAPWLVRNAVTMGAPVLSAQRGYVMWGAHNEITMNDSRFAGTWIRSADTVDAEHPLTGTEIDRDRQAWQYGLETIRRYPDRMPYLTVMKLWRLVSPVFETSNRIALLAFAISWCVTAPFVAGGIWIALRDSARRRQWMILVIPVLSTILMTALFYGSPRFRDALAPLFLIPAAVALVRLAQRMGLWREPIQQAS